MADNIFPPQEMTLTILFNTHLGDSWAVTSPWLQWSCHLDLFTWPKGKSDSALLLRCARVGDWDESGNEVVAHDNMDNHFRQSANQHPRSVAVSQSASRLPIAGDTRVRWLSSRSLHKTPDFFKMKHFWIKIPIPIDLLPSTTLLKIMKWQIFDRFWAERSDCTRALTLRWAEIGHRKCGPGRIWSKHEETSWRKLPSKCPKTASIDPKSTGQGKENPIIP